MLFVVPGRPQNREHDSRNYGIGKGKDDDPNKDGRRTVRDFSDNGKQDGEAGSNGSIM